MRRTNFLSLSVLLLLSAGADLSAQKRQDERTLLWEISGNGLPAPSYLYGTMHVYNKRAFDFSDSVLLKLRSCTAFAGEVMMESSLRDVILYYRAQDSIADAALRTDETTSIAVPDGDSSARPSASAAGEGKSETRRRTRRISVNLFNSQDERKPGDSPVVLDAYLSRLAKREGKEMLALEEVGDQLDALSYRDPIAMWKFYFSRPKHLRKMTEEQVAAMMLRYYTGGEVEKLHTLMRESLPPVLYRKFILDRNRNMAERGEEYIRRQPTFMAVGAGHLGGEQGLIRLFRERGFTVRPVRATRTGLAKNYREPDRQFDWFKFSSASGAYSVELPSEPINIDDVMGVMPETGTADRERLYLWMDVLTGISYKVGYIDSDGGVDLLSPDGAELGSFPGFFAYEAAEPKGEPKPLQTDGVRGVQADAEVYDGTIRRSRVYLRGGRFYVMSAQTVPELMESPDPERFFSSFRMNEIRPPEFREFVSTDNQFSVMLPGAPEITVDTTSLAFHASEVRIYSHDENSGDVYNVASIDFSDMMYFTDTASVFYMVMGTLQSGGGDSVVRSETTEWFGFPARDIETVNTTTGYTRRERYLLHGSRVYALQASGAPERMYSENGDEFFNSFRLHSDAPEGNIFSDKKEVILSGLVSGDERRRSVASILLRSLELSHADIPLLHAALREPDHDDDNDDDGEWQYSRKGVILEKLAEFPDSSAVEIVRSLSPGFRDDAALQSASLSLLAAVRTPEALDLFLDIILADSSGVDPVMFSYGIFAPLHKDLPASRRLYPAILPLLQREKYASSVYGLTSDMLREGLLSPDDIAPVVPAIRQQFLELLGQEPATDDLFGRNWLLRSIVECVGFLPGSEEVHAALGDLQNHDDAYVASEAITASIRQGVAIRPGVVERLSGNPETSIVLYRELEENGQVEHYPAPLREQRTFAEQLFIYWLVMESGGPPDSVRYLAEREVGGREETERVFLFAFRSYPGADWNVGISGSQPLDRARLNSSPELIGSDYTLLDADTINGHFESLLQSYGVSPETMP